MSKKHSRIYKKPLTLESQAYPLRSVVTDRVIANMAVINDGCLSLLIEEEDGTFYLYFPEIKPKEEWREIKKEEAEAIKARIKETPGDEMPPIDEPVDVEAYGIDCNGNLWVLGTDHKLYYFENPHLYVSKHEKKETFQGENSMTTWTHLKVDCDIPQGSKLVIEVTDGTRTEKYSNHKSIYLYEFFGETLHCLITLCSNESCCENTASCTDADYTLTPTLYGVTAVSDAQSYVDYLPVYYKEGPDNAYDPEVLYRYLAMFQEIMETLENNIEHTHEMLKPCDCDSIYLAWLSSLLGIARDHRWPEQKWRQFLKEAPILYRGLGTKASMQRAIELYCDEKPGIERVGAYEFCVKLSGDKTKNRRDVEVIESIIWAFKPAHTVGRLYVDHTLDENQTLIVGESVLPFNTEIE